MADQKPNAAPAFASPPCFAHELAESEDGFAVVDPQQALDVARWRHSKRKSLRAHRAAMSVSERALAASRLGEHLVAFLKSRFSNLHGHVLSGYWPIKSELDLRDTLAAVGTLGAQLALPVVEEQSKPLVFHAWRPGDKMERGFWGIAVPAQKNIVTPDILLAPLVGWDRDGYRLGYGGGYFDRTLAKLETPRLVIGVGLNCSEVKSIYPPPHDIRLDAIITDDGLQLAKS